MHVFSGWVALGHPAPYSDTVVVLLMFVWVCEWLRKWFLLQGEKWVAWQRSSHSLAGSTDEAAFCVGLAQSGAYTFIARELHSRVQREERSGREREREYYKQVPLHGPRDALGENVNQMLAGRRLGIADTTWAEQFGSFYLSHQWVYTDWLAAAPTHTYNFMWLFAT